MNSDSNNQFDIQNLTFYYPNQEQAALHDVTLSFAKGEFLVLVGPSGCGKSTLLRHLKTALTPHGIRLGHILFEGRPIEEVGQAEQSASIGFVHQNPDSQIVTDKVWHELAFGLESLGLDTQSIRKRVAEMAGFFGIESWFYQDVAQLSGGQKQILNLAAIMAAHPSILVLDEPTSQLDPIAASDFLSLIGKIHRELGTTILMTEHRLEEVFPMADRVLAMDDGRLIANGTPQETGDFLKSEGHAMFLAMPAPMRIWAAVESAAPCPLTVRDGRDWLAGLAKERKFGPVPVQIQKAATAQTAIQLDDVWFKYERSAPDVVKGLSMTVQKGEIVAVLGGNGTGKTTALSIAGGLLAPYRGKRHIYGNLAMMPQNPQTLFVKKSVREDLQDVFLGKQVSANEQEHRLADVVRLCRLERLLERHPFDLSGGEQQRAAFAKILLLNPDILLLDEPTKGFDAEYKHVFAAILKELAHRGVAILLVSHDVEFCAEHVDRCALFFDGAIITGGPTRRFFTGNTFYTTAAHRMARSLLPDAVTAEDVIACLQEKQSDGPHDGKRPESEEALFHVDSFLRKPGDARIEEIDDRQTNGTLQEMRNQDARHPLWRKWISFASAAVVLWALIKAIRVADLSTLLTADGLTGLTGDYLAIYAALIAALFVFAASTAKKAPKHTYPVRIPKADRTLPKRTIAASVMILLLIPLTIFAGTYYFGGRKYYFIALLILFETMLPFFLAFESRKPKARELVLIAALCALGVASRAALFMLPNFKPVMALVILSGVAFGGETGFLVGSMTMLVSNTMFGQGPWTPWQMFAMGIVGFLAGVLFRKGLLARTKTSLCAFGALSAIVIYGGIMNPAAALLWTRALEPGILLPYFISGLPIDIVHASATALILWFAAEPMLEKLDRINIKYGLIPVESPAD